MMACGIAGTAAVASETCPNEPQLLPVLDCLSTGTGCCVPWQKNVFFIAVIFVV